MTVCVATITARARIIGASDRMITSGDIEFEPLSAKVFPLTNAIYSMWAGDASLQAELLSALRVTVSERVESDPETWLSVREVADLYKAAYQLTLRTRAAEAILAPLGLDLSCFNEGRLSAAMARELASAIISFTLPTTVETIICGVDDRGPHIWRMLNGDGWCEDFVGFAAIGAGARHANSQLMMARYDPSAEIANALWHTYIAKRRSEVAPGVGIGTDMFLIGQPLGSSFTIPADRIAKLEQMYARLVTAEERRRQSDIRAVDSYLLSLVKQAPSEQQLSPDVASGSPPPEASSH